MHKYNSNREPLILREYGRNVQNLAKHASSIADKGEREQQAQRLLKIMTILCANRKTQTENAQKRWQDLIEMSDYTLDVDTPFPIVRRALAERAPQRIEYIQKPIKLRNYGRNIERLIQKAIDTQDTAIREQLVTDIARLMKQFGGGGNSDKVDFSTIAIHLQQLSGGKLTLPRDRAQVAQNASHNNKEKGKGRNGNRKKQ